MTGARCPRQTYAQLETRLPVCSPLPHRFDAFLFVCLFVCLIDCFNLTFFFLSHFFVYLFRFLFLLSLCAYVCAGHTYCGQWAWGNKGGGVNQSPTRVLVIWAGRQGGLPRTIHVDPGGCLAVGSHGPQPVGDRKGAVRGFRASQRPEITGSQFLR